MINHEWPWEEWGWMLFCTVVDLECYRSFAMANFQRGYMIALLILNLLTGGVGTHWINTEIGFGSFHEAPLWCDSQIACLSRELKTSCWPMVEAPLFPCEVEVLARAVLRSTGRTQLTTDLGVHIYPKWSVCSAIGHIPRAWFSCSHLVLLGKLWRISADLHLLLYNTQISLRGCVIPVSPVETSEIPWAPQIALNAYI